MLKHSGVVRPAFNNFRCIQVIRRVRYRGVGAQFEIKHSANTGSGDGNRGSEYPVALLAASTLVAAKANSLMPFDRFGCAPLPVIIPTR
jgi:hypothetical protein